MAITLPENSNKIDTIAAMPSARLKGVYAPQISGEFINTIAKDVVGTLDKRNTELEAELKKRKEQSLEFQEKRYKNEIANLTVEAKAKVAESKGTGAVEIAARTRKELQEEMDKRLGNVPPELKERFASINDSAALEYNSTAIPHEYREMGKIRDETYAVDTKNTMNRALGTAINDEAFALSLSEVAKSARDHAKVKYGDGTEEAVTLGNFHVKNTVSATILGAIARKAEFGDTEGAENTSKKFMELLTPEDQMKANDLLEKSKVDSKYTDALREARQAKTIFPGDIEAQNRYLQAIFSDRGDAYVTAVDMVKTMDSIEDRAKKRERDAQLEDTYNEIADLINKHGEVPPDMIGRILQNAPTGTQTEINNYIKARANVESDPDVYNSLVDLHSKDPDSFVNTYKLQRGQLSKEDYKQLSNMATAHTKKETSAKEKLNSMTYKSVKKEVDIFMENRAISDPAVRRELYNKVNSEVEALKDIPGITPLEIEQRVIQSLNDSEIEEGTKDVEGTGWTVPILGWTFGEDEVPALEGTETIKVDKTPIPGEEPDVHPSIIQWLQKGSIDKFGRAFNANELRQRVEALRKKIDVTQPISVK